MKIWYQSYSQIGADPKWSKYEQDLENYVRKVARPDTKVDIHGVKKTAPKMTESDYLQYLHLGQIIEMALQAEREGYDAFCIGGAQDLGHNYIKEILDIPVAFIAESSFYHACLLSRKFGIIGMNSRILQRQMDLVKFHGLEQRCVPGTHLDSTIEGVLELCKKDPKQIIDRFNKAAREIIVAGAGALIPGFGALGSFLGEQNIHDVDGVPIVDIVAVVIKTAEMLVDMQRLGEKRNRGSSYNYASKDELLAARKLYGII